MVPCCFCAVLTIAVAFAFPARPVSSVSAYVVCRQREAIECLKRALIGADPMETAIHLRLAKLHYDMYEYADAASYHRHVVDLCMNASESFCFSFSRPWTHRAGAITDKPVIEYAKSAVHVARYHLVHGGGDLALARAYLEKVVLSNAEEVREATELLKRAKFAIVAKEAEAAQATVRAMVATLQDGSMTHTEPASV